ncbi:MAG: hypothetical protein QIT35_gp04 [Methanophagales virus PBV299]|uniref:Uncharacterized protein n=1 Tax=Methanophagales virus PBV299 TaxID=2987730 RepID=A0ABY6GN79_9CAUD|nr:MAG: hypothetical protein QIT35_gp04 [Methanophagales virus PBV299]UYL64800.1 MAG: hypothetical protein OFDIEDLO_00004 [Methanophagales virus PBV299]
MPTVLSYENFEARYKELQSRRKRRFLFTDASIVVKVKDFPVLYFEGETTKSGYTVKRGSMVEIPVESKEYPELEYLLTNERVLAAIYEKAKGDIPGKTFKITVDEDGNPEIETVITYEDNHSSNFVMNGNGKENSDIEETIKSLVQTMKLTDINSIANLILAQGWAQNMEEAKERARRILQG